MTPAERVTELLALYGSASANAAELLCDWHPADDVAFTVVEGDLSSRDLTYGQLRDESARFAAALAELGVEPGDAVAALMGKSAELVVALLGIWRRGGVHVPLFTAFAPAAIALRLQASGAKVVLVDTDQRAKLQPGPDLPDDRPWQVVVVGGEPQRDELSFQDMIAAHRTDERGDASVAVGGDGVLVLLFTSGTTGTPKGVPVPVKALASFVVYLELGLDVTPDDVFWNAADPGWAYGLYYAILAPMAAGRRSLLLHAGFTASLTYQVMSATASRTSPRRRLPGWSAAVLDDASDAGLGAGQLGRVAIRVADSPLMWFTGYADAPEKTAERFTADSTWYLTGDAGRTDEDGWFYFSSRDDDIIIMAGYRIGPFDVESVLVMHPESWRPQSSECPTTSAARCSRPSS